MLLRNKLSFYLILMCMTSIHCQQGHGLNDEKHSNNRRASPRSASIGERSFGPQPIYDFTITQSLPLSAPSKNLGNDDQQLQKRSDSGFPSQTSIFYASDDLATPAPQTRQLPAPQSSTFGPTPPPSRFGQRNAPEDGASPKSRQVPNIPSPSPSPPPSIISLSRSFFSRAPATFPPAPESLPSGRNAQGGDQPQPQRKPDGVEASMTKAIFRGLHPQTNQPQTPVPPTGRNAFQGPVGEQPQFADDQSDSHQTFPSDFSPQGAGAPIGVPNHVVAPQPIPHATFNPATAAIVPPTTYSLGYPPTFLHSPEVLVNQNVPLYAPGYSLSLSIPFGYGLPSHTEDIVLHNSRAIHTISGSLLAA